MLPGDSQRQFDDEYPAQFSAHPAQFLFNIFISVCNYLNNQICIYTQQQSDSTVWKNALYLIFLLWPFGATPFGGRLDLTGETFTRDKWGSGRRRLCIRYTSRMCSAGIAPPQPHIMIFMTTSSRTGQLARAMRARYQVVLRGVKPIVVQTHVPVVYDICVCHSSVVDRYNQTSNSRTRIR